MTRVTLGVTEGGTVTEPEFVRVADSATLTVANRHCPESVKSWNFN